LLFGKATVSKEGRKRSQLLPGGHAEVAVFLEASNLGRDNRILEGIHRRRVEVAIAPAAVDDLGKLSLNVLNARARAKVLQDGVVQRLGVGKATCNVRSLADRGNVVKVALGGGAVKGGVDTFIAAKRRLFESNVLKQSKKGSECRVLLHMLADKLLKASSRRLDLF